MERGIDLSANQVEKTYQAGQNYLLVIGIDEYEHWEKLNNAVKDAKDVVNTLTHFYQFESDNVYTLYNKEATESNIYKVLKELRTKSSPSDNLLIYFSGHGHYDHGWKEGYWVPVDAEKDNEGRYLSNSDITTKVNAIKAHHVLMIIDSCFSGSMILKERGNTIPSEKYPSRRVLASGRTETVSDGKLGENSPFASMILTYLKANTDGAVKTTSMIEYVKDQMSVHAKQTPVDGRLQNSQDRGGEFVFHLKITEEEFWTKVLDKNELEGYQSYLMYFPEGKHVQDANHRIEDYNWHIVQERNDELGYKHYINDYPKGRYLLIAKQAIDDIKEDEVWRVAKSTDALSHYEDYLKKYFPRGKYVEKANERIKIIHEEEEAKRIRLNEQNELAAELKIIKEKFAMSIEAARNAFKADDYEEAKELFRASISHYRSGFIPNLDYIDGQIDICTNKLDYLSHWNNGNEALDEKSYDLAIQYFEAAQQVDNTPEVRSKIQICKQKMGGRSNTGAALPPPIRGSAVPPPLQKKEKQIKKEEAPISYAKPQAVKEEPAKVQISKQINIKPKAKKKKRSYTGLFVFLFVLTLVLVGAAVINNIDNSVSNEVYNTSMSYEDQIIGKWRVTGTSSYNPNTNQTQIFDSQGQVFEFYNNNTVSLIMNGAITGNGYWGISGNQLAIRDQSGQTTLTYEIESLSGNRLVLVSSVYDYKLSTYINQKINLSK
ncbi:MAG: caspase family protein [Bacteroidota bacterium]